MRSRTPDLIEWAAVLSGLAAFLLWLIVRDAVDNWQPPDGYGAEIGALLAFVLACMIAAATLYSALVGGI